jgi:sigma-B regulation protein RsbU (phosphoserine phosphatase)
MSSLPAVRGLIADIQAVSRPARTFTGDFYYTHREDDRLWLAHGDVAGKGLPAAIVMAMIQEELEHRILSCAATACEPSATIARLHEFLLPLMPINRFATAVIATLDEDGTLMVANGGHCPPLILRNDGSVEVIGSTGPLLGILKQPKWTAYTTRMEVGETLVLYSDGVSDALGNDGVQRFRPGNARAIVDAIESELLDQEVCDDVTVVAIQRW